jgi:bromodomain adjacent to zinc finger domain protein 1A
VPDTDKQDVELKKKKPIKYPIEDLDVERTEKDKKSVLKKRPLPQTEVPFGEYFEPFFMSWCYLQTFGSVSLKLP